MYLETVFYVYAYLRETDSVHGEAGTPYYIGKGKGRRAYLKKQRVILPPKNKDNIKILISGLSEQDAFINEMRLIAEYGRIDLGTGCLHNKTNGGEGLSGFRHSEATKLKMSAPRPRKKHSSHSFHSSGFKHSVTRVVPQELRDRISKSLTGRSRPQSVKDKISATKLANPKVTYRGGKPPSRKGVILSEETKRKMSESHQKRIALANGIQNDD